MKVSAKAGISQSSAEGLVTFSAVVRVSFKLDYDFKNINISHAHGRFIVSIKMLSYIIEQ